MMKLLMVFMFSVSGPALATVDTLWSPDALSPRAEYAVERVPALEDEVPDPFDELFGAKKSLVVFKRKKVALFENVKFEPGRSSLNVRSQEVLTQVSTILIQRPDITLLHVDAHTDSLGPSKSNKALSLARAQAVVTFLVNSGVDPKRLVAVGHGESKPLLPNDCVQNRAANRRTEFRIMTFVDKPLTVATARAQ